MELKPPGDWKVEPLGKFFRERREQASDSEYEPLSVSMAGVVPRMDNVAISFNGENRKLVRKDDFVINSRSDRKGSAGVADRDGSVSLISIVLEPCGIEPRFVHHLLRSTWFQEEFYRWGSGIVDDLWSTRFQAMKRIGLPIPPVEQQRRIADYLDRETATIDALIEKQQSLLRLLEERRATVRKHFALCGLNDGIESVAAPEAWAGAIPSHWDFVPLMSVSRLGSGHTPSKSRPELWVDTTIPWISLRDVGSMRGSTYIHETHTSISELGLASSSARLLPAGTVVLSRDATIGRTAIMGRDMATSQHFAAWTCGRDLIPEYLHLVLSGALQDHLDSLTDGSTLRTIGMGDIRSLRIPLPPVDEQQEIVKSSDRETAKIDALIAKAERFIELAQERRTALITAAVTGQLEIPTED